MKHVKVLTSCIVIVLATSVALPAFAQSAPSQPIDLAVSYYAAHSLKANTTQDFWRQGGSLELGVNFWHGLGAAVDVSGDHSSSVGSSRVPLSLVTIAFGPRYRWRAGHKLSLYGQALVGEANGFESVFPATGASQSNANSLSMELGGGIDYTLSRHFAVRALEASYVRTQLPNAGDNLQNSVKLGAGFVLRFR